MEREIEEPKLGKVSVLKVDKDCHIDRQLEQEWVRVALVTLRMHHESVEWIEATRTRHGNHYYIKIDPAVSAKAANNLQYLLGDDANRVDYNRARINSEDAHWNRLFEDLDRRKVTLYSCGASATRT
jgi:uncharacterized glyoxalase superfamily metalloenzyme YdcJ